MSGPQCGLHRRELRIGLGQLSMWIGGSHEPRTRKQAHPSGIVGAQLPAAQRDRPFAVALSIDPAD